MARITEAARFDQQVRGTGTVGRGAVATGAGKGVNGGKRPIVTVDPADFDRTT
jgi:hypothetical protein